MALSRRQVTAQGPLSIPEIVAQAEQFDFTTYVALQKWIRAAKLLLTEASICEQDGNLQMAYLYLYRHAQLVLDRLPRHPDYNDPHFKDELSAAKRAVRANLPKLEDWKPRIQQYYDRYMQAVEKRDAERERLRREREAAGKPSVSFDDQRRGSFALDDGAFDDGGRTLNAHDHRELAVDLAHREIRRRDATRQSTREAGISPGTVASRRRGIVVGPSDPDELVDERGYGDGDSGVRDAGRYLQEGRRQSRSGRIPATRPRSSHAYKYPVVPTKEGVMDWNTPPLLPTQSQKSVSGPPPAKPAKESFNATVPAIPPRPNDLQVPKPATAEPSPQNQKYTFHPTAFTEAGTPLRTVLLPPNLRTHFLNLAHPNTARNLETCGILCGTLISNALFISHLIIPDQKSTSDTCDTTDIGDTELFDECDSKDLLVCGWIHTHPTQTCFLSSRDLHTSSGYQIMLPEAIAIVCAPRQSPDWGIFRLTSPPGLQAVLGCRQTGLFHPHAERDLYTDALRPGHVVEAPGLEFEVVDLRRS